MASLQDIQGAFNSKQALTLDKSFQGANQVGFVGDQATLGGKSFSSAQDLYNAVYGGGGSSSSSSSSSSTGQPDFESTLNRALEIQQQAVQPAVQSLQASIPEIQQSYATQRSQLEAQKDPLTARYDALIADISHRQGVAETGAIKTTSQELGRRGIVGSSGVADTALQQAVQPIQSEYAGLSTSAELGKQEGLQSIQEQLTNLTPLEVEATRNVNNAIAQLQSATTKDAVNQALSQLQLAQNQSQQAESQRQFNESQSFSQQGFDYQKSQDAIANQLAQQKAAGTNLDQYQSDSEYKTGFKLLDYMYANGESTRADALASALDTLPTQQATALAKQLGMY